MRFGTTALLAGTLLLPVPLAAQQLHELLLVPGAKVRVTAPSVGLRREVATLELASAESLVVRRARSGVPPVAAVPLAEVQSLEVSLGRSRRIRSGILIGALAVGATGGAIAFALWAPCEQAAFRNCPFYRSRAGETAAGVVAGAIVGAWLGSVAERASARERWVVVPLSAGRLGLGTGWRP